MNFQRVAENIRAELKAYVVKSNLKSLVLGISGGIDSALVAALAKPVCDELGIPLIGRSITITSSNKKEERDRADLVGKAFCTDYKEVDLTDVFEKMRDTYQSLEEHTDDGIVRKIREGNLKARIRMTFLYNIAQANKGMVLSTDNLTESASHGCAFFTLHGDVGDYGMIQNIWKTEVYELAQHISDFVDDARKSGALRACIAAMPTDGLGVTEGGDLQQLQCNSYEEVDLRLKRYLDTGEYSPDCPVIKRHLAGKFKANNPYNIPRDIILYCCSGYVYL